MSKSLLVYHSDYFYQHKGSSLHPESPARVEIVENTLNKLNFIKWQQSQKIKTKYLTLAHDEKFINNLLKKLNAAKKECFSANIDQDTFYNANTLDAILHASGALIDAAEQILDNTNLYQRAFSIARPPGHHAETDIAMGFCFINHIALVAKYLTKIKGLDRVLIFDFDVHHGNGTENIVRGDNKILYISTYQEFIFPNTTTAGCFDNIINQPLSYGCNGDTYMAIYHKYLKPKIIEFAPQFILISAGFDAHKDDPLASLSLLSSDFARICEKLRKIADEYANGYLLATLEGGYNLAALGESSKYFSECLG